MPLSHLAEQSVILLGAVRTSKILPMHQLRLKVSRVANAFLLLYIHVSLHSPGDSQSSYVLQNSVLDEARMD